MSGFSVHGKVLMLDESRCTGCLQCSIACSVVHTGGIDLERAHINVWRVGRERYVALTCHHCEMPACARACPTKACHIDEEDRRVVIDAEICIGCRTCVVACPFGHAHFDRVARVSVKCDYCDGDPACVTACEAKAITYVSAEESSLPRRRQWARDCLER